MPRGAKARLDVLHSVAGRQDCGRRLVRPLCAPLLLLQVCQTSASLHGTSRQQSLAAAHLRHFPSSRPDALAAMQPAARRPIAALAVLLAALQVAGERRRTRRRRCPANRLPPAAHPCENSAHGDARLPFSADILRSHSSAHWSAAAHACPYALPAAALLRLQPTPAPPRSSATAPRRRAGCAPTRCRSSSPSPGTTPSAPTATTSCRRLWAASRNATAAPCPPPTSSAPRVGRRPWLRSRRLRMDAGTAPH